MKVTFSQKVTVLAVLMALATFGYGVHHIMSATRMSRMFEESMAQLSQERREKAKVVAQNRELKKKVERMRNASTPPGISQDHLKRVIGSTLNYLEVPPSAGWENLILLTIATESDMGRYLKQVRGPARGVVQVEPATERCVLDWMKARRPDLYRKVKALRIPARLAVHEAEYNLTYAVALCYGVYHMRKVDPKGKGRLELARLYKKYYNTVYGKATVNGVMDKLMDYKVKL